MVLPLVDGNAEHATLQSVTVVVPAEHDSVDDDALLVVSVLVLLVLGLVVGSGFELGSLLFSGFCVTSGSFFSSGVGGLSQLLRTGLQEISNSGRPGKSQTTAVATGSPQTITGPPQSEHQITGTTVEEL
jgi:hypothetical protein